MDNKEQLDTVTKYFTNTKAFITITGAFVSVLFFFFTLRSDIQANVVQINMNTANIKHVLDGNTGLQKEVYEQNTNIKLLQQELKTLSKSVDNLTVEVKKLVEDK